MPEQPSEKKYIDDSIHGQEKEEDIISSFERILTLLATKNYKRLETYQKERLEREKSLQYISNFWLNFIKTREDPNQMLETLKKPLTEIIEVLRDWSRWENIIKHLDKKNLQVKDYPEINKTKIGLFKLLSTNLNSNHIVEQFRENSEMTDKIIDFIRTAKAEKQGEWKK